jgi:hypothetical protein
MDVARYGQALARRGNALRKQEPGDLHGKQGVAAGSGMDSDQDRSGEGPTEAPLDDVVQRPD